MRKLLGLCLFSLSLHAELTPEQKQLNIDSFEKVWTTIRDKHWEKNPGGLNWQAVHEEYRPKIEKAETMDQARAVMRGMLGRLKQTHFGIFPASVYNDVDVEARGDGSSGIDLRVLNGQAIVTRIDPESPAEKAGVKPGWQKADPAMHELTLERAVIGRLNGPVGDKIQVTFIDGNNRSVPLDLALAPPRGQASRFGNLPPMHVWVDTKQLGNTGYIGFNMFLDLPRVMGRFGDEISSCLKCDGLIIDLRGNPGGIGGMAMGMAGWLLDKPDQRLGTMYMRDATLNFVVNPRPVVFAGPVAILVDGSSASTSEILAGGLKDLGRAKVFGTRTAAAALPSVIEKLPNGDGFQYAMANYISEGGKPLEGVGVAPDVEVNLSRDALLAGHDPVVDAAVKWINSQRKAK